MPSRNMNLLMAAMAASTITATPIIPFSTLNPNFPPAGGVPDGGALRPHTGAAASYAPGRHFEPEPRIPPPPPQSVLGKRGFKDDGPEVFGNDPGSLLRLKGNKRQRVHHAAVSEGTAAATPTMLSNPIDDSGSLRGPATVPLPPHSVTIWTPQERCEAYLDHVSGGKPSYNMCKDGEVVTDYLTPGPRIPDTFPRGPTVASCHPVEKANLAATATQGSSQADFVAKKVLAEEDAKVATDMRAFMKASKADRKDVISRIEEAIRKAVDRQNERQDNDNAKANVDNSNENNNVTIHGTSAPACTGPEVLASGKTINGTSCSVAGLVFPSSSSSSSSPFSSSTAAATATANPTTTPHHQPRKLIVLPPSVPAGAHNGLDADESMDSQFLTILPFLPGVMAERPETPSTPIPDSDIDGDEIVGRRASEFTVDSKDPLSGLGVPAPAPKPVDPISKLGVPAPAPKPVDQISKHDKRAPLTPSNTFGTTGFPPHPHMTDRERKAGRRERVGRGQEHEKRDGGDDNDNDDDDGGFDDGFEDDDLAPLAVSGLFPPFSERVEPGEDVSGIHKRDQFGEKVKHALIDPLISMGIVAPWDEQVPYGGGGRDVERRAVVGGIEEIDEDMQAGVGKGLGRNMWGDMGADDEKTNMWADMETGVENEDMEAEDEDAAPESGVIRVPSEKYGKQIHEIVSEMKEDGEVDPELLREVIEGMLADGSLVLPDGRYRLEIKGPEVERQES